MNHDPLTAFLKGQPERLPFRFAGRISDSDREVLGRDANGADWNLIADGLAGSISHERPPLTAEERDILLAGLQWTNLYAEDEDERALLDWLEAYPVVSQAQVDTWVTRRWRFEPAEPAGDAPEGAAISTLSQLEGAQALLTAWRLDPAGQRKRAYCIVGAPGSSPKDLWGRVLYPMRFAHSAQENRESFHESNVLEAVVEGESWPVYHRRLVEAAVPIWVAAPSPPPRRLSPLSKRREPPAGEPQPFDIGRLRATQPEPFELVDLDQRWGFFPGLPDHDAVDMAVVGWAAYHDHVLAVLRCWAQPREGEETRVRTYGLVVDDPDVGDQVRDECAEVVHRAVAGKVAIEVMVPTLDPPEHQRSLIDHSVPLWEQDV